MAPPSLSTVVLGPAEFMKYTEAAGMVVVAVTYSVSAWLVWVTVAPFCVTKTVDVWAGPVTVRSTKEVEPWRIEV